MGNGAGRVTLDPSTQMPVEVDRDKNLRRASKALPDSPQRQAARQLDDDRGDRAPYTVPENLCD
jgi:hypothetical protein